MYALRPRTPERRLDRAAANEPAMVEPPESTPNLFPASRQPHAAPVHGLSARPHRPWPCWVERVELFVRVLLRIYIGLAVCYVPWSANFWDHNPLFVEFPLLGHWAATGAVRGLISGLGLLNLWVALREVFAGGEGRQR